MERERLAIWRISPSGAITAAFPVVSSDSLLLGVLRLRCAVRAPRLDSQAPLSAAEQHQRGFEVPPGRCDDWRTPASPLFQTLLPPAIQAKLPASGELLIIPQGSLFAIPFVTLLASSGAPLGDRFTLRIAPSLQTLGAMAPAAKDRAALRSGMFVVGHPTMSAMRDSLDRVIQLPSLPGAEREAIRLRDTFGARR